MEKKPKIRIIGTSHISPQSIRQIEHTIRKESPDCIAVELDAGRLHGLLRKEPVSWKSISQVGVRNFAVAKIFSVIQRHLGKKTGVMPGEEMLTAVKMAQEVRADLVLIDQDIRTTLERIRKIPFSEKLKLFLSFFRKTEFDEKIDLRKVPIERVVGKVLDELRKTAPTLHSVLVKERDEYMAKMLFQLSQKYDRIIAVVGVGHKKGIIKELKRMKREKKKLDEKITRYKFYSRPYPY